MTYITSPLHRDDTSSDDTDSSACMSDAFDRPVVAAKSRTKKATSVNDSKSASPDAEKAETTTASSPTRLTVTKTKLPMRWLPKGAILRLNLLAELAFFAVFWAAYGFVMSYLPVWVRSTVEIAFSPWAIALCLLVTGWLGARFFASLSLRFGDLQRMAWTAQQLTESDSPTDVREAVLDILFGAKESIAIRQKWLTTLYCASATYQLVSLLY
ncbi:MAG: hypothetical protein WA885_04830 [Phormidesmis sp.]